MSRALDEMSEWPHGWLSRVFPAESTWRTEREPRCGRHGRAASAITLAEGARVNVEANGWPREQGAV